MGQKASKDVVLESVRSNEEKTLLIDPVMRLQMVIFYRTRIRYVGQTAAERLHCRSLPSIRELLNSGDRASILFMS